MSGIGLCIYGTGYAGCTPVSYTHLVHTNDPGLAIQRALTYGQLSRMKIDNMREAHQEKLKAAKWELLNDYTEQVKNSIDKVDQLMYDIYANDKNFQALQKEQSSAKEYSTVYDLREKLHTRLILSLIHIYLRLRYCYQRGCQEWYSLRRSNPGSCSNGRSSYRPSDHGSKR